MQQFTANLLVLIVVSTLEANLSADDCFYHGKHRGKKCFYPDHVKYACCPLDEKCQNGTCKANDGDLPSNPGLLHIFIIVGAVLSIAGLVTVAMYYHRRQMQNTRKQLGVLGTSSQSSHTSARSSSSVGVRMHSSLEPSVDRNAASDVLRKEENI